MGVLQQLASHHDALASFVQIEELGKRSERFFAGRKPSIGRQDVERVSLDELVRQPDQRELTGDRIFVESMLHVLRLYPIDRFLIC